MTHPADGHWYTLDTLTFMDFNWFNDADRTAGATMKIVEGLTHSCEVVEVVYYATRRLRGSLGRCARQRQRHCVLATA